MFDNIFASRFSPAVYTDSFIKWERCFTYILYIKLIIKKQINHSLRMACNVLYEIISYVIGFLYYVIFKFMFSDLFRTGKTPFILTFKDTKTWRRLTLLGSSTCWGWTSYFLISSCYDTTLSRLTNLPRVVFFTIPRGRY